MAHGLSGGQMSGLHWRLRRKGWSYRRALDKVGKAKWLSKRYFNRKMYPGKMKSYHDYDGDGKVNKYDCYPFDKRRQDDTSAEYVTLNEQEMEKAKKDSQQRNKELRKLLGHFSTEEQDRDDDTYTEYEDAKAGDAPPRSYKKTNIVEGSYQPILDLEKAEDKRNRLFLGNNFDSTYNEKKVNILGREHTVREPTQPWSTQGGLVLPAKAIQSNKDTIIGLRRKIWQNTQKNDDLDFTVPHAKALDTLQTAMNKRVGLDSKGQKIAVLGEPIYENREIVGYNKAYQKPKEKAILTTPQGKRIYYPNKYYQAKNRKQFHKKKLQFASAEKAAYNIGLIRSGYKSKPREQDTTIFGEPLIGTQPSKWVVKTRPTLSLHQEGSGYRTGGKQPFSSMLPSYPHQTAKPGKAYGTAYPSSKTFPSGKYDKVNETSYLRDF